MIDSHAHVSFYQFDDDRKAVIKRAQEAGVGWLEVGTDLTLSKAALALSQQFENVWPTAGVHPSDIRKLQESSWQELEQLISNPVVVAVGEVGLDYYRGGTRAGQIPTLERFVNLALQYNKPVIFHVRDPAKESSHSRAVDTNIESAHDDMITFLSSLKQRPAGVMHTFSGTVEQAEQYLKLGMHLSFSGVVTFKNASEITEVARTAPIDSILIETDCPFLTPEPHRGLRNEPAHVRYVGDKIAELRVMSVAEVASATEQNTRKLFKLG